MRLFLAIPTPPEIRSAALAAGQALGSPLGVRWVKPDLLHLTLKFLGEVPEDKVEEIQEAAAETANKFSPFMVCCGGADAFPSQRRPRVIVMGVEGEETATLIQLATSLDEALFTRGFLHEERAFRPHLTIGRIKEQRGPAKPLKLSEVRTEPVPWPVERFELVQSTLRPGGPEYQTLQEFHLGGGS